MKILVVSAHEDDEVLGCGGTMARHIRQGDSVHVGFMTSGREGGNGPAMAAKASEALGYEILGIASFQDNAMDKSSVLRITQFVEDWADEIKPDIVYTHHRGDLNIDHQLTHRAVMTAFRPWVRRANIYSFEVPSATECGLSPFMPNHYVKLQESDMKQLDDALNCYMPELTGPRVLSYNTYRRVIRGSEIGTGWAEAFQVERQII